MSTTESCSRRNSQRNLPVKFIQKKHVTILYFLFYVFMVNFYFCADIQNLVSVTNARDKYKWNLNIRVV